ncbi:MAG: hypothetical protein IJV88_02730 [Ruminococcus sp.]|nr:hypothetical protein [Ruminococcus sp.]
MKKKLSLLLIAALLICTTVLTGCQFMDVLLDAQGESSQYSAKVGDIIDTDDPDSLNRLIYGDGELRVYDDPMEELQALARGEGVAINTLSKLASLSIVEVVEVTDDGVVYSITSPDMSDFFNDREDELAQAENADEVTDIINDYAQKQLDKNKKKQELVVVGNITPSTPDESSTSDEVNIDSPYKNKDFLNALLGGLITDYEENEETLSPESTATINNGSAVVRTSDYIFYLIDGDLIREDSQDNRETIASIENVQNNIYILNDTIYVSYNDTALGTISTMSFDFDGNLLEENQDTVVIGIAEEKGVLITGEVARNSCADPTRCEIYNPVTSTGTEITSLEGSKNFLHADTQYAYFACMDNTDYSTQIICRTDLDLGTTEEISRLTVETEMTEFLLIEHSQLTDKALYVSYGFRGGSGNFFQRGAIARIDKEDCSTTILTNLGWTDGSTPYFNVFLKDSVEHILYKDSESTAVLLNCETLESETSAMNVGPNNKPFVVSTYSDDYSIETAKCLFYPLMTGECVQLLPDMTLTSLEDINKVYYTGDKVFYTILYIREDPEALAWWEQFVDYKEEYYSYDTESGTTTLLGTVNLEQ